MILSVEELKLYISTDVQDAVLEAKLQALEILIRKYTNNNFQNRKYRTTGNVEGNELIVEDSSYFKVNDTIMINSNLCVITEMIGHTITINYEVLPEKDCLVTKIEYPMDVVIGIVNMMKWDLENRAKVGIQSETISRHSVTYFNMDGDNSLIGYPKSLVGFLKPHMRARF